MQESKKGKKGLIILFVIIALLFVVYFIVDSKETKYEVTTHNMYFDGSTVTVTGECKNLTNKMKSLTIEYCIYDVQGNNIGTAFSYIKNLEAGGTAYFEAELLFCNRVPHSYKLVEVKEHSF